MSKDEIEETSSHSIISITVEEDNKYEAYETKDGVDTSKYFVHSRYV